MRKCRRAAPRRGRESLAARKQRREGDEAVRHPHLARDSYATITVSINGTPVEPAVDIRETTGAAVNAAEKSAS